ncbi:DUF3987 domain-containing protein [Deltaproteobacteria bacterium OttesenSCG-928-K17]|nr:DUF3987 domain-containing protein [Deltaproteobacteria bacterium OttesenSCG-928-K17]
MLAAAGYKVFPVYKNKRPLLKGWQQKATTDPEQIRAWFDCENPPEIGVMTGRDSGPFGLFCLDVDGAEGLICLEALEKKYGPLERLCVAQTPSGGLHVFFRMPDGVDLRNSAGKLGRNLDTRGQGGYVVVAPSQVFNRQNILAPYRWISEVNLADDVRLPLPPGWLVELLTSKAPPASIKRSASTAYGQKALEAECSRIASASLGTRNVTLNKSAFAIFQLVSGGVLPAEEAEARLHEAARFSGLDDKEIRATINSARTKAALSPRSLPESACSKVQSRDRPWLTVSPAPAAPLDVFPPKIQKMLKEAAVAFKQLPIEVPIVALLGMLTACLGQSRLLKVKDNWEEAGNLYLAMVAVSGLGKSPCFKAFLQAVWKEEIKNKEEWDEAMACYNAIIEERRQRKDRQNLPDLPPKPVRTQYIIEDATTEAIGAILAENPMGLLWYSDELASIILNLDRYSSSKGGDKPRMISIYDRAPWKTSRRDHEREQVIASAVLSIVGTVQPKVLKELFSQTDAFSGLLPRFIFILAKREAPGLLTDEIFTGQEILEKICGHLLAWRKNQSEPRKVKISPEAYLLYVDWHNQVMREAWQESEIDNAIAAKLVTQVLRLALLLHSLNAALDENDGLHDLEAETMRGAISLGWWIREHQRRIWQALDIQGESVKTPLEGAIIKVVLKSENDLAANDWKMLNDDFNNLVAAEYGQELDPGQLGREAIRLGIAQCLIGKKRGKLFSPELVESFRVKMYI